VAVTTRAYLRSLERLEILADTKRTSTLKSRCGMITTQGLSMRLSEASVYDYLGSFLPCCVQGAHLCEPSRDGIGGEERTGDVAWNASSRNIGRKAEPHAQSACRTSGVKMTGCSSCRRQLSWEGGNPSIACEFLVMQYAVHRVFVMRSRQEEAQCFFQDIPCRQRGPREELTKLGFLTANSSDTKTFSGQKLYTS
jgi:hypothetical protein